MFYKHLAEISIMTSLFSPKPHSSRSDHGREWKQSSTHSTAHKKFVEWSGNKKLFKSYLWGSTEKVFSMCIFKFNYHNPRDACYTRVLTWRQVTIQRFVGVHYLWKSRTKNLSWSSSNNSTYVWELCRGC